MRSEGVVKDSLRVSDWMRVCVASLIDDGDNIFLIQSKRSAEGQMRVKNFYCMKLMKFEIDNPEIINRMIVSMTVSQHLQEVKLLHDLSLNTED